MVTPSNEFTFSEISVKEVEDQMRKINIKKGTKFKNIPPKILKENADICCPILTELINDTFRNNEFPHELKVADVTPV